MNGYPSSVVHAGAAVSMANPLPIRIAGLDIVGGSTYDAFGRSRVSSAFTLGDYSHIYRLDPNFVSKTTNGATVTHAPTRSCAAMTCSNIAGSEVIFQTRPYHHYMPGKSHLVLSSFNIRGSASNIIKRVGYFDAGDGMYLEVSGSNAIDTQFVVRNNSNETRISRATWIDPVDGTGPSGVSLDWTKTQLMFIDFQWLGVGRIRFGFVHDGCFITANEVFNSNRLDTVYIRNPALPVRAEISVASPAAEGAPLTMDLICATVISEGGYNETGIDHSIVSSIRTTAAVLGTTMPVLCIALTPTFHGQPNRMLVRLVAASVFAIDHNLSFTILRVPSISDIVGGTWVAHNENSSGVQYNTSATSITILANAEAVSAGFAAANQQGNNASGSAGDLSGPSTKRNYIAQNMDANNSEVYVVMVKTMTSSASQVSAVLQWREVY